MKKIRAIIADDEELVRERICELTKPYDWINIIAKFTNGIDVVEFVNDNDVDLLFLDIKMPKASGFDVLKSIDYQKIKTVFITAYDKYALQAFDYAAFDYLIKPIGKTRFDKTISRLSSHYNRHDDSKQFLSIKSEGSKIKISINEISHIEADDNYIKIHVGANQYKKRHTLSGIESELRSSDFLRVHRSYLVNSLHIVDMARIYKGDYLIKMRNGRIIPTSRSYRDQVKNLY